MKTKHQIPNVILVEKNDKNSTFSSIICISSSFFSFSAISEYA